MPLRLGNAQERGFIGAVSQDSRGSQSAAARRQTANTTRLPTVAEASGTVTACHCVFAALQERNLKEIQVENPLRSEIKILFALANWPRSLPHVIKRLQQ